MTTPRHLGSVFGLTAQQLLVQEADLERAKELLREWSESKPDYPDDLAE